jgi:hypothetical protein
MFPIMTLNTRLRPLDENLHSVTLDNDVGLTPRFSGLHTPRGKISPTPPITSMPGIRILFPSHLTMIFA